MNKRWNEKKKYANKEGLKCVFNVEWTFYKII